MKKPKMRIFGRFRTLKELKAVCKEKGWKLDSKPYQKGSDYVIVDFCIPTLGADVNGTILLNGFNGRFFGTLDSGVQFDSSSFEHERKRWFQVLLEAVYVNEVQS